MHCYLCLTTQEHLSLAPAEVSHTDMRGYASTFSQSSHFHGGGIILQLESALMVSEVARRLVVLQDPPTDKLQPKCCRHSTAQACPYSRFCMFWREYSSGNKNTIHLDQQSIQQYCVHCLRATLKRQHRLTCSSQHMRNIHSNLVASAAQTLLTKRQSQVQTKIYI